MTAPTTGLRDRIRLRIILPCIAFMLLSSLDRTNLSFAALGMNRALGLSPSQYGFGAGILFLGFLAGQYPSILLLQRFGMRRWLAGSAILWGLCAGAMGLIETRWQFYGLRILLGMAEGGLAPGIVLYLSQWATERERASTFALPMLAIPLSIVVGGPVSGALLGMAAPGGLDAWRWMFIAEAVPTILGGLAALAYFPDRPAGASWLSADEKGWLEANAAHADRPRRNDWTVLRHPLVWASALLWFCLLSGSYGIMFWLPQMIHSLTGLTPLQVGLVNALPWVGLTIGMYFNAAHSDRTGERFWHIAVPAAVAALALLAAMLLGASAAGLGCLFVAGLGLGAAQGSFWALPTTLLRGETLAVGVVAINIAGSSGGLVMPELVGLAREASGDFTAATLLVAGILLVAALLVVVIRRFLFPAAAVAAE